MCATTSLPQNHIVRAHWVIKSRNWKPKQWTNGYCATTQDKIHSHLHDSNNLCLVALHFAFNSANYNRTHKSKAQIRRKKVQLCSRMIFFFNFSSLSSFLRFVACLFSTRSIDRGGDSVFSVYLFPLPVHLLFTDRF